MPFVLCRKSDGVIVGASRWDAYTFDPATHIQIESPTMPDVTAQRWDGATGLRADTPQETTARLDAKDAKAFDDDLMLMSLARWTAQKLSIAPATAKAEILAIYRNLRG